MVPGRGPDAKVRAMLSSLSDRWGWFVALGAIMVVLGLVALAHVVAATLVSVLFIAVLMIIGGIGQLIHAWRLKQMSGFVFWTIGGVLYLGAGVLALFRPEAGASLLTLLFGATLIGSGALRLWIWFNNRAQQGWQWLALSGAVTLLVGLLIAFGWPGNSVWVLGLILGIDLLIQGWTLLFIGLALRSRQSGNQ
ncbi:MAG: HdeD family acid-resistance protein [Pusillimonas sp.]|nr:HdeD family acid-resistance protein [Pusillimonas sp.]